MSIINQLAASLNRRDEQPNKDLAIKIAADEDTPAVAELLELLKHENKNVQADVIKVVYEIGMQKPHMIKAGVHHFIALLDSKNNRIAWGAMMALNAVTPEVPAIVYKHLPRLVDAANEGPVITRDNLVSILVKLEGMKEYNGKVFPLLLEQLVTAPQNQFPTYAEQAQPVVLEKYKEQLVSVLQQRLPEMESEPKKKRLAAVIKKLMKKANATG